MANEKEVVERLMAKVEEMRAAQRAYFRNRTGADQRLSMALESDIDKWLVLLRRRGYDPDKWKGKSDQQSIF